MIWETNESDKLIELLCEYGINWQIIADKLDRTPEECRAKFARMAKKNPDIAAIKENVRLHKTTQRYRDKIRISTKRMRELHRAESACEEYSKAIQDTLDKYDISKFTVRKPSATTHGACGILHLSDNHLNELINVIGNVYDFGVASQRLKLLVDKVDAWFKTDNIQNILICMTGDMINSDRRLDELLSQATNRANATVMAVYLYEQVICDLIQRGYTPTIACVSGNESRVKDELGWVDAMATDNYDFTIFNMLKWHFRDNRGVVFIDGDPTELIVKVAGHNILLLHGHNSELSKKGSLERSIQNIVGKYSRQNVPVRFVLSGHLHSCYISDYFARSSSLPGDNAYSQKSLQLSSRASQNAHKVFKSGNIDSAKFDLQNTDGVIGYDIIKAIESYNAKSAKKTKDTQTIMKIVI